MTCAKENLSGNLRNADNNWQYTCSYRERVQKESCVRPSAYNWPGFPSRFGELFFHVRRQAVNTIANCSIALACVCAMSSIGTAAGGDPVLVHGNSEGLLAARSYSEYIVIGFLGGFVAHDEPHHPEVRMIQTLRRDYPAGTYFDLLENKHVDEAYRNILARMDADRDGVLSEDEKHRACIELFGHSWGASAVVSLARKLGRIGIPVQLTVQVDSVAKLFQNDNLIPANVNQAANFYQTHGLIHGEAKIVAADPSHTSILGNFRRDYDREPEQCQGFSWHARLFTKAHIEIECDPEVWEQVESMIREHLPHASAAGSYSAAAGH